MWKSTLLSSFLRLAAFTVIFSKKQQQRSQTDRKNGRERKLSTHNFHQHV